MLLLTHSKQVLGYLIPSQSQRIEAVTDFNAISANSIYKKVITLPRAIPKKYCVALIVVLVRFPGQPSSSFVCSLPGSEAPLSPIL